MSAGARFGSAAALREDAARLRERGEAADRIAGVVRRTDVGWWTGEASDAFAEAMAGVCRRLMCAADDSSAAAEALERHADTIAWAEARAGSQAAVGAAATEVLLQDLRDAVAESAQRSAGALRRITEDIDPMPDVWDVIALNRDQYWRGVGEGVVGMLQMAWDTNPARMVLDPTGYYGDGAAAAMYVWNGLREDPVGLAKDVTDYDTWRTEPVRAGGRLMPEALMAAATGGAGAAGSIGRRGVSSAAVKARGRGYRSDIRALLASAAEAGHTVARQRTPGWMTPDGWPVPAWLADAAQRIPESWGPAATNSRGVGFRWFSEDLVSHGVRIDEGNALHAFETQHVAHVVVRRDGRLIGRDGVPISGSLDARFDMGHIPLTEWMTWREWGQL
ncbi:MULTISPECIES: putative T7SS-secreted protein [unclassified Actinotalea]|uniref:putative T7SS-secreted protein n=1 Tax=unclassified Actinotalea TaxID=2638618 RepID=UPI0015F5FABE|nr:MULTISPECIES: hypothetical protein [unclassified Actinotalea]